MNKRSKKTTAKAIKIGPDFNELWPQERDYMLRPDRLRYVRKLLKPKGCVFCKAWKMKTSFESLVLYKTKNAMVIINKYPYNTGHLMVIPRQHKADMLVLSEKVHLEVTSLIRKSVKVLKKEYKPSGFNVGLNQGAIAGAGIPDHLHWHIIPRWGGDTNFFPLIAETKVLPESLEQTYERLQRHFK